ncbi:MAG: hypothetical protein LBG76_08505, partial [Treponema sp.]|nr:hypothetical protein [Treponema sp.]
KAEYQALFDKKTLAAEKKKLVKEQAALQKQFDSLTVKTYSGIWKDDVTTADWPDKAGSIQAKKDYFQGKLNAGGLTAGDIAKYEQFIKDLDEFAAEGQRYHEIQAALEKVQGQLTALKKGGMINVALDDAFSQARKDAALWAKSTREADTALRDVCGEVWRKGTDAEKDAIYHYTQGSGRFNRPLSGFRKPYNEGGNGWEPKYFKGVNRVWIDFEGAGDEIRAMTNLIGRSEYDIDVWLQRGSGYNALESHLGLSSGALSKMTQKELQQFIGRDFTNYAFTSSAVNKGAGFSGDVIWNIYAPKGTQMMYAEPFSAYGNGGGLAWDGISKQKQFGGEAEMIIQRGARYKITKIEKKGGQVFMDIEVHPEKGYDLIQQNPGDWKGSREAFK